MEEFNLKETVGDSKPAVKNNGSKKKIILIILVVIGLIGCYLVGYIIGTNLGKEKKDDKKNNTDIKEETKLDEELVDENLDETDEEDQLLDEEFDESEEDECYCEDGLGVVFVAGKTKEEKAAIKIAEELYEYGSSALLCGEFDYGKNTSNGFIVNNFEQVNNKFTKDSQVDSLAGGNNFKSFKEEMGVTVKDGKYYMSHQCDRGGNFYNKATIVELISYNDNEIKMQASSIYIDEEVELEKYDFIIRKENNEWKIAKMTSPY